MNKHTILVVEDEALIAANLVHILSSLNYDVPEPVATGDDAIRAVKTKKPDLVLMDIQLIGEMNGIETAEKIRAIADIPVVYLTAYADDLRLKQAKLTDPYGYLIKPVHSRELNATIQMALYKHGLDRKLKTSEEKYRNLSAMLHLMCDNMPDMIWAKDLEKRYIFTNKAICSNLLNAADTNEPIGKQDMFFAERERIRHKDDPEWHTFGEICRDTDQITMDAGTPQQFDEYGNVQGKFLFLDVNKAPFIDGHGKMIGTVGSARDVTISKQLEEALKESEERLRLTLDAVNDGIWDWDIPTGTAFFSPRWYSMLGYAPDEMPGSYITWRALIHPDDIVAAEQTIQDHFMKGEGDFRAEFRMRTKDGDWKWILSRGRVVKRDADCKPVRMLGTHTDITGRKNTEAAFQAMIRSMVGTTGFNSLQKITENISSWLGAECVMVGEIQPDRQTVKVLSMLLDGKNIPDFTYSLKGTPCDNVAEKGFCIYPDNVTGLFPGDKDLVDLNIRGYIGTPLRNSQGFAVGILCALFRNPVKSSPAVQEIMTIIAVKAAAEIERKRAEEALRESENRFRKIFENSPLGMTLVTPDFHFFAANPGWTSMTGYSEEELRKLTFKDITHPDHLAGDIEHIQELVAGKIPFYATEKRYIRKDGSIVWGLINVIPIHDNDGRLRYFATQIEDITVRKRAEETLHESARYTRNLIEVSLDPLVTISPEGKITDVNTATERVTGYTRNHLIGTDFSDYFTDPMNAKKGYMKVFDDDVVRDYPLEIRHRDGKVTPVMYNATIYPDESGNAKGIFAAARDITERKLAEEALHKANKKLTLLSSITRHDINNQLTVLIGYLTILKRKLPDPVLNDYFVKVGTAAQHISSMIQFTKEYESIGVKAPAWQNCRTVADTAAKDAQPGQIMIKNDLPNSAEVFADPLVVKVFYNLIDNAVRYGICANLTGKFTPLRI